MKKNKTGFNRFKSETWCTRSVCVRIGTQTNPLMNYPLELSTYVLYDNNDYVNTVL